MKIHLQKGKKKYVITVENQPLDIEGKYKILEVGDYYINTRYILYVEPDDNAKSSI